jgi:hypothetical protein
MAQRTLKNERESSGFALMSLKKNSKSFLRMRASSLRMVRSIQIL